MFFELDNIYDDFPRKGVSDTRFMYSSNRSLNELKNVHELTQSSNIKSIIMDKLCVGSFLNHKL